MQHVSYCFHLCSFSYDRMKASYHVNPGSWLAGICMWPGKAILSMENTYLVVQNTQTWIYSTSNYPQFYFYVTANHFSQSATIVFWEKKKKCKSRLPQHLAFTIDLCQRPGEITYPFLVVFPDSELPFSRNFLESIF